MLNEDRGEYTYKPTDLRMLGGVREALQDLKKAGFLLIVVSNQGGIAKGLYGREDVWVCHRAMQAFLGGVLDDLFFSADHPDIGNSLSRKPSTYLFERAVAHHKVSPDRSWMIGDKERDLLPARKMGMRTVYLGSGTKEWADVGMDSWPEVARFILGRTKSPML